MGHECPGDVEHTPEQILEHGIDGARCCHHISEEDLTRLESERRSVIWAQNSGGYATDRSMVALVELVNGFAVLHEGEDYTGHGCQCGAEVTFYRTLDEAIRLGLTQSERDDMNRELR